MPPTEATTRARVHGVEESVRDIRRTTSRQNLAEAKVREEGACGSLILLVLLLGAPA